MIGDQGIRWNFRQKTLVCQIVRAMLVVVDACLEVLNYNSQLLLEDVSAVRFFQHFFNHELHEVSCTGISLRSKIGFGEIGLHKFEAVFWTFEAFKVFQKVSRAQVVQQIAQWLLAIFWLFTFVVFQSKELHQLFEAQNCLKNSLLEIVRAGVYHKLG